MNDMTVAELIEAVRQALPSATINYNDSVRVTLCDGGIGIELRPNPIDELPSVTVTDRLAEILGLSAQPDYRLNALNYSYRAGYEDVRYGIHGSMIFSGAYHPDAICEGRGICKWCGRTLTLG